MARSRVTRFLTTLTIGLLWVVSCVSAHRHHHRPEHVKYSYGIYAPTGWTVAFYIWYIVKLGFILGALLLLLFSKKWNNKSQPIILESGPQFYHHRSFDGPEHNLFKPSDRRDMKLFWSDRIRAIADKLK